MPAFNFIGFRTLFVKEIRRFSKVWLQTVLSPLVTTCLYFLVFGVALGSRLKTVEGVPYIQFVIPGLMTLAMVNAAFFNSSSSLFQSKINGTSVDLMVAPMGALEILFAYVGAAMLRAHIVGLLVYLVAYFFTSLIPVSWLWTLYFTLTVSACFSMVGILAAVFSVKFDHLAIIPNFILSPLTFLGGVFYSIRMLPEPWSQVSAANPILYMVGGLRASILGTTDVPLLPSALAVGGLLAFLLTVTSWVLARGVRLRF